MITGRDIYEDCPDSVVQPSYDDLSEEERAGYQQTAKEVNEGIWHIKIDTLLNMLGQGDGVQAYAQDEHGNTTIVTQFLNWQKTGFNWTCHDPQSNEYARFSMNFDEMAMLLDPDPSEPIWREWKETN